MTAVYCPEQNCSWRSRPRFSFGSALPACIHVLEGFEGRALVILENFIDGAPNGGVFAPSNVIASSLLVLDSSQALLQVDL